MHWGSTRTTDEILAWAGVHCVHDAENLSRQDKAALLVNYSNKSSSPITVRVCYSEVERDGNCGRCEKCYRTILNLVLSGADPRRYGLPMDQSTYERLFKRMLSIHSSKGLMLFWAEISLAAQKALSKKTYFVLYDELKEEKYLQRIASGEIDRALKKHTSFLRDEWSRFKFVIRVRYKRLYAAYQFIAQLVRRLF